MFHKLLFWALLTIAFYSNPSFSVTVGISEEHAIALSVKDGRLFGKLSKDYQCLFDSLPLETEYVVLPQKRILQHLEMGLISIAAPLIQLDSRDEYALFATPLLREAFYFYSKRKIDPTQDLSDLSFVFIRSAASKYFATQHNAKYGEVNDWTQTIKLVQRGRYDAAILPIEIISSLNADIFKGLQKSLAGYLSLSIYISKKHENSTQLLNQINHAIQRCQKTSPK